MASQFDFGNIDPAATSGTDLANILESWRDALHSSHKGAVRPSYVVAGTMWIKDGITPFEVNFFDGANDVVIGTLNATTGIFKPFDQGAALATVARTGLFSDLSGAPAEGLIFITATDTTPGFLDAKLKIGAGFTRTINNPSANEEWQLEHDFASQAEAEAGSDATKPMTAQRVAQAIAVQGTPAGVVQDYAGTSVPTGWVECDGAAISRTTFAALFTAIGTIWGIGDGSTTFNVPNLQRRTTIGSGGSGSGTIGNSVGDTGGEEDHVLTEPEMPSHDHDINSRDSATSGGGGFIEVATAEGNWTSRGLRFVSTKGSDAAHNTIQSSAVMLKIIKT